VLDLPKADSYEESHPLSTGRFSAPEAFDIATSGSSWTPTDAFDGEHESEINALPD
jgi:hypothetical protein